MLSFILNPRNENDPPDSPILSSLSILFCYHQGTVVKGSFLITVVRIPRTVLMYIYNTLKDQVRQHLTTKLITGKLQQVPWQECDLWQWLFRRLQCSSGPIPPTPPPTPANVLSRDPFLRFCVLRFPSTRWCAGWVGGVTLSQVVSFLFKCWTNGRNSLEEI